MNSCGVGVGLAFPSVTFPAATNGSAPPTNGSAPPTNGSVTAGNATPQPTNGSAALARSTAGAVKQVLVVALSGFWIAGIWAISPPALAKNKTAIGTPAKPDPDALLIEVYKDLAANRLRQAQSRADALVEAYPNFQLGHLIRGDLLLMHTRPVTTFGAVAGGSAEKLDNLRAEAMARLKSLRERPDPNLVPRSILQLRGDQKYALIVDAKRSRLYVYENKGGQPKFVADYYISQGKLGVNKLKEGDQKTPLGVYYITGRLAGARLPDFYGAGALPISYPNEWDKLHGRSGSGIWLHGTPSDSFSRPPLSSDGCVVLTNPDLHKLSASVEIGKTPIVISDQVEFVSKAKWDVERSLAAKLVDGWRRDVESLDPARLMANYSQHFKSAQGENLDTWFVKQQQSTTGGNATPRPTSKPNGVRNISLTLRDTSFFIYPGQEDLIVGTFTQDASIGNRKHSIRKRQYWAREGAQWKIVSETNW
ncbi:MAG TPA: L,D-transpeptidase family protein [Burkholderiaceae bacterium]|nr:L,D-transpeptidase family protein [Burkholderiaceae bacterium]